MRSILLLCLFAVASSATTNKLVKREIDISNNYARVTSTITAEGATSSYYLAFSAKQSKNLAQVRANQDGAALVVKRLEQAPAGFGHQDATFWEVSVASPSKPFQTVAVFTDVLRPKPAAIEQKENQLVDYVDNVFFFSPYATTEQTTTVKLASTVVEHHTRQEPTKVEGDSIIYGPYKDKQPFSAAKIHIHYQNNKPFVVAETLRRTYHVSHWGALRVEEHYKLKHVGAALKGVFSRLDYQRVPSPAAVPAVTAVLPAQATDIYFRDQIGNISTSVIREGGAVDEGKIEVDFYQRFPLFGGWQNDFYFGYTLPLDQAVSKENGEFVFTFAEASPLKNMVVRSLETTVILPNGASPEQRVVISKTNVVTPEHSETITVRYRHSSVALLREPLMLTTGFFAFCVATLFLVRI